MGVNGLMPFIAEHAGKYQKPFELKDTWLVIDGNNVCGLLYSNYTNCLSSFGGDYVAFYRVVKEFFIALTQCRVTPLVIFDGLFPGKKLQTITERLNKKVEALKKIRDRRWRGTFNPMFLFNVFCEALTDLNIRKFQCLYDADEEIVAAAKSLGCPVLSKDSDFFLADVQYIVFDTLKWKDVNGSSSSVKCLLYTVDNLLDGFPGLQKSMLPLVSAALGNDYIQKGVLNLFVTELVQKYGDKYEPRHVRIVSVLRWLQSSSSVESAVSDIEKHLGKAAAEEVLKLLDDWKVGFPSSARAPLTAANESGSSEAATEPDVIGVRKLLSMLPPKIVDFFHDCQLCNNALSLALNGLYIGKLQVEDLEQESSVRQSVPIITSMSRILSSFTGRSTPLSLMVPGKSGYKTEILDLSSDDPFPGVNLRNLMNESARVRCDFLDNVMRLSEREKAVVESFDNDWALFVISIIYWTKSLRKEVRRKLVNSLVLMAAVNYLRRSVEDSAAGSREPGTSCGATPYFSKRLLALPHSELQAFPQWYDLYWSTTKMVYERIFRDKGFPAVIHSFASFQSILFHVQQLNVLLDYPFPDVKISKFYSGKLLCSLYYMSTFHQTPRYDFASQLRRRFPGIFGLYGFAVTKLHALVEDEDPAVFIRLPPL